MLWLAAYLPAANYPKNNQGKNLSPKKVLVESFGSGGQIKMLYDRRQRPQCVLLDDKLFIVYNGCGTSKTKGPTFPLAIVYDMKTAEFSYPVVLGPASRDHHYGPVIWADRNKFLHVLFGCHRTPGTHLISKKPADISDWRIGPQIAPSISYPSFHRIFNGQQLIYYRTEGHISSWTYRISKDNGNTWYGPEQDVTDLDSKGRTDWASYHTVLPSRDGRFLHVAFIAYDDNRSHDPKRYYNPRYKQQLGDDEWKYNLYYIKIDLSTGVVMNDKNEVLKTPIDIDYANQHCCIWDTEWRGAGVPPDIVLDKNGNPAFLHVLSKETIRDHSYYYVRKVGEKWVKTEITHSNHQWNSCHIYRDDDGTLHAFLIVGEGYLDTGGEMDQYGGGNIEEWISMDDGNSWKRYRDLTPFQSEFSGWRYNNIQPVVRPDGSYVKGMLLFYGWKDKDAPKARAFLLRELEIK